MLQLSMGIRCQHRRFQNYVRRAFLRSRMLIETITATTIQQEQQEQHHERSAIETTIIKSDQHDQHQDTQTRYSQPPETNSNQNKTITSNHVQRYPQERCQEGRNHVKSRALQYERGVRVQSLHRRILVV